MKDFFTIDEIAEYFDISRKTVERLISADKIKAFKIGDIWRISKEEVARIKEEGTK